MREMTPLQRYKMLKGLADRREEARREAKADYETRLKAIDTYFNSGEPTSLDDSLEAARNLLQEILVSSGAPLLQEPGVGYAEIQHRRKVVITDEEVVMDILEKEYPHLIERRIRKNEFNSLVNLLPEGKRIAGVESITVETLYVRLWE